VTDYTQLIPRCEEQLKKGGAFLMTGGENPNPMTIGWCQWGRIWNRDVCTVFVRPSRHSHGLIENGRFTVSVPMEDQKEALAYCGAKSGRDGDKLAALGLGTVPPKTGGGVPGLAGACVHFECKVLMTMQMGSKELAQLPEACRGFYDPASQATPDGDPHTVYFAEILEAWESF